ncbi:respiratory nitrate reductase subunit gamma [Moorella sulfitireducens]|uniref:respiratory nitrate reductase subunit gamma n=1 Tax=Neomoorella sulfitireducens TaxID=2972948 RepID=UPI0021AC4CA8|nr:respiratory nitrate reductase subunit gamma [Moorella sulfitireducens]
MALWELFTIAILPYLAIAVLVLGLGYKIIYWLKAPVNLHWELFPYPRTSGEQAGELLTEVFTLRSLYMHNRRIWLPSLVMHYGIYLVVFWLLFLVVGLPLAVYLGVTGGCLVAAGSLLLFLSRLINPELRRISEPVEYLNLAFLFLLAVAGLIGGVFRDFSFRTYIISLLTLKPHLSLPDNYLFFLLLFWLFMLYIPFTRMAHFAVKYFTYHKVKWGEME